MMRPREHSNGNKGIEVGQAVRPGVGLLQCTGWGSAARGAENVIAVAGSRTNAEAEASAGRTAVAKALATFELFEGMALPQRLAHCMLAAAAAAAATNVENDEEWEISLNLAAIDERRIAMAGTGEGLVAVVADDGRVVRGRRRVRADQRDWRGLTRRGTVERWEREERWLETEQANWSLFAGCGGIAAASDAELTLAAWSGRWNVTRTAAALIEETLSLERETERAATVVVARRSR